MSFSRLLKLPIFCSAMLLHISTTVNAQTPAPLATPDLKLYTNGTVNASLRLADGSVLFGGSFSQVNGVQRQNLARLNANGDLDPTWNPGTDYPVKTLVVDGNGNVYVGGNFGVIGGQLHSHVAKLSADGAKTVDPEWNAAPPCINFYTLAVDTTGDLFVGGYNCVVGTSITGIVKLSGATGALVSSWIPQTNGSVTAIAVDSNTSDIYVGGTFSSINGAPRKRLAKISGTGTGALDTSWNPAATPAVNGLSINTLAPDDRGNLYVGGLFAAIGGQARSNLAKLSATGTGAADATWNPSADGPVNVLALDAEKNLLYVGGSFATVGGQTTHHNLARISTGNAGSVDTNWSVPTEALASNVVKTISLLPDGGTYAGGFFSTIAGKERHSFVRIDASGTPHAAVDTVFPYGTVRAIAVQPNGGIVVGGYFSGAGSLIRSNLLRILPNGNVDPNWSTMIDSTHQLGVEAISIGAGNSLFLGGDFTQVGDQKRMGIAKISVDATVDPTWAASTPLGNPASENWYYGVKTIASAPDGGVYLGGDFATVSGQPRMHLAKISTDGVLDSNWKLSPDSGSAIRSIAVDGDGSVFVGGDFYAIGGQGRYGLAKFSANGSLDPSFVPDPGGGGYMKVLLLDGKSNLYATDGVGIYRYSTSSGKLNSGWNNAVAGDLSFIDYDPYAGGPSPSIYALALDASGNLFAGGVFTSAQSGSVIEPHTRPYLAKFATASGGVLDLGWNPVLDDAVYALATDGKGALYTGGVFSRVGNQMRGSFAALPVNDAANPILDHLNQFGWTGAWYNPLTSGQGILLQIIPGQGNSGTLFGGWFTYDSPYSNPGTGQRWYTLQGPVDVTSRTASVSVYSSTGYRSPPLPSGILKLGDALLTFTDCTHASLTYWVGEPPTFSSGVLPFALGTMELTRLGSNPSCTSSGDTAYSSDFLLSGGWYDPAEKYSGLVFDVDPSAGVFFAAWYRNFFDGNSDHILSERWYTIQGPYAIGVTSMQDIPIYQGTGGVFDTPSKVTVRQVGSASLVFQNCANAILNYHFTNGPDAGSSGQLALGRGVFKPSYCSP